MSRTKLFLAGLAIGVMSVMSVMSRGVLALIWRM
jgi:hypothetical protein